MIAAEQYASRLVLPSSQQQRPLSWSSHKDQAAKALAKLAGPHLPASLKQLEKAIATAKADYDKQLGAVEKDRRATLEQRPQPDNANDRAAGDEAEQAEADEPDGERNDEVDEQPADEVEELEG